MNAKQKEGTALQGELSRGEHLNSLQKKKRGRRGLRKSLLKKWQVYAWGLLVFFSQRDCSTFNMERDRHRREGSAQIQRYINMTALMGARLKTDRGLQGVQKKFTNRTKS